LAWRSDPRRFYRLSPPAAALVALHAAPRDPVDVEHAAQALGTSATDCRAMLADLCAQGVLTATALPATCLGFDEPARVAAQIAVATPTVDVVRPLWVHLQPFTRCNQHCVHCYCDGGPKADPFLLTVQQWHDIIARLDDHGVLDVYITGGESLLYPEFFDLAEDILNRGMGFGVSTNATLLSDKVLARLRDLRIGTVQVSLDGGNAGLHEHIRAAEGSFARTLEGIDRIGTFCDVVINTVVNRLNLDHLTEVVRVGVEHGCSRFKFFPQKPVGRSDRVITLSDAEILDRLVPECSRLAERHTVEIETVDAARPCGSGSVGFAIDQRGDIYPCIFGVRDPAQCAGNILADDLAFVWFTSPVLERFRAEVSTPCRRCES
jgi:MoaA/NifB/PqqE/SkfB family radical SAM enzyme